MTGLTLFEKLWRSHVVRENVNQPSLLYVDRHLIYEVTSPQAFEGLRLAGRGVCRAEAALATCDHNVPTIDRDIPIADPLSRAQVVKLDANCREFGIRQFGLNDFRQGIVHVVGPEQGMTLPGTLIVCGDSHTSTHGAFAALAFGIGTSEVEHVLATQCLSVHRMKTMRVVISGSLPRQVFAKDVIMAIIARIGTAGATGHAVEFTGETVAGISMEARMTLCNMAIEAGARVGLVAVDDRTIDYVRGRPFAPKGTAFDRAERYWRTLVSDPEAHFDMTIELDAGALAPQVTWGTSPEMVVSIDGSVPDPADEPDPVKRKAMVSALNYMGLEAKRPMREIALDKIFIGSCTNGRIEDLRAAAAILIGKHVAPSIKQARVVPGSGPVKAQAEAEGLDAVFIGAGFEWRAPGCSMCLGMNADRLSPKERCASTSNRNFQDRQGVGGRSHLVSPAMAAAAAIAGHFFDVRSL